MKISKFFTLQEFKCNCGKCETPEIDKELLAILDDVREWSGGPVFITSGYRCPEYNKKIGGAARSKHLLGCAADIVCKRKLPKQVYDYLNAKYPNYLGLAYKKGSFTHIDTYGDRARRWTY